MTIRYSRRSFFAHGRTALASLGFTSLMTPIQAIGAERSNVDDGVDYYAKLGVQEIINAAGTYTFLTAAVMPESVNWPLPGPPNIPCVWRNCNWRPDPTWRNDCTVKRP